MKFIYKSELDKLVNKFFGVNRYKLGLNDNIVIADDDRPSPLVPIFETAEEYGKYWVEYPDINKVNCPYAMKYACQDTELATMWALAEKRLELIENAKKINPQGNYNLIVNNTPKHLTVAALVLGDDLTRKILLAYDSKRNLFNQAIYSSVNVKEALATGKGTQPGDQ